MTDNCKTHTYGAGGCQPLTEPFWARRPADPSPVLLFKQTTCVAGRAVVALTTDRAGSIPATGFDLSTQIKAVVYDKRGASCEDPIYVVPCTTPVNAPALSALACDGVTTIDVQADPSVKQIVNAPGTSLSVRMCGPTTAVRIEFSETVLYSASTEQTVVRIREFDEDNGTWGLRYENLDGTPFLGPMPGDLYEVTAQVAPVVNETLGCVLSFNGAGFPVTEKYIQRSTKLFDAETGALESTTTEWEDATGTIFTVAPVGFVLGTCPDAPPRPNLIWLERSGGLVTMADIMTATGAVGVGSVTVKQIQGRGTVNGDSGSGVPLDIGETWSWGVISQNQTESLSASALSMDATGGEQRITAVYWV